MKKETIEFLRETQEILKELEMSKESVLQAQEDLENAYDIEDDNERIDEQHRLEIEHSDRVDNVDYLEKHISEEFTTDVAKELVPFVKKLLKYTSSIQHRLDSIAYDARELSDENELDDEFYQANEQLNQQKVSN